MPNDQPAKCKSYLDKPPLTQETQKEHLLATLNPPLLCCVCPEKTTGAHSCKKCSRAIHSICATPEKNRLEVYGSKVVCPLCAKTASALENRNSSKNNLQEQAKKMQKISEKKFPPVSIGTTVRIPVPEVDRGRGDARNILAIVLQKTDDELYKSQDMTLRSFANIQSIGKSQGFVKCSCKHHCDTQMCLCVKKKILCTSKCHNSSSCKNK